MSSDTDNREPSPPPVLKVVSEASPSREPDPSASSGESHPSAEAGWQRADGDAVASADPPELSFSELPAAKRRSRRANPNPNAVAVPPPDQPTSEPAPRRPRRKRRSTLRGVTPSRPGLRTRAHTIFRDLEARATSGDSSKLRIPIHALRVTTQVLHQWARDRCPQQAASLAFQTVLSVVPLAAVTLAVLRATGSIDAESVFVDYLARELIPVSRETIATKLVEWSKNINFQSLGMIGLVTIVFMAFIMINSLEKVINHIWRSERRRSITQKFVVFYAAATIGPFLFGTSVYQASQLGLTSGISGLLFNFATTLGVLFLANYFLPACNVRVKSALMGAAVSAVLFEGAKLLFASYVTAFADDKWTGIYGAIAVVPLWLLWIYWSWLVFLLGIEVAHAWQNLHLLRGVDRRSISSLENELLRRVNGVTAARVMVSVTESYITGNKVTTRATLEDRYDLSSDVLDRITQRLKDHDLLLEVSGEVSGFVPARPPHEITLADVFGAFRGDDFHMAAPTEAESAAHRNLDKVLREIEADTRQRTGNVYLDELV